MDKRYYAILKGQLTDKVTHVKAPLHKYVAANGERRVVVAHEGEGQSAHTQFNIDQIAGDYTAVRVKIFTGRTHQIRVHMQHLKHPIIGDPLYGGSLKLPKGATEDLIQVLRSFKRQALHAEQLSFEHPITGEEMKFEAPMPADMKALVDTLRADTKEAAKG